MELDYTKLPLVWTRASERIKTITTCGDYYKIQEKYALKIFSWIYGGGHEYTKYLAGVLGIQHADVIVRFKAPKDVIGVWVHEMAVFEVLRVISPRTAVRVK